MSQVFLSLLCVGISVSALEWDLLCVYECVCVYAQSDPASDAVYDGGCPNLWKQWVVSNQFVPLGFS